jgi:hypothetical protein
MFGTPHQIPPGMLVTDSIFRSHHQKSFGIWFQIWKSNSTGSPPLCTMPGRKNVLMDKMLWCSKHDTNFQILFYLFFSSFSLIFLFFLLYFFSLSHFFSDIHSDILIYYWRIRIYGKLHSRVRLAEYSLLIRIRSYSQINIFCRDNPVIWHFHKAITQKPQPKLHH